MSPSADVAVTKTASAATLNDGQEVTFTVTAKNNGPDAASGVAITDLLPAGLEYVSSSVSQGSYEKAKGIWSVGSLANAASATLTITAKATKTGSITNTATKTAENENDPVAANNSSSATVEVSPSADVADLALEKTVAPGAVEVPGEVSYTLTVSNAGPDAAQGVVVTDPLPAGETYAADDAGCTVAGQMVTCGLGELANKAIRTIHLRVHVGASVGADSVDASKAPWRGLPLLKRKGEIAAGRFPRSFPTLYEPKMIGAGLVGTVNFWDLAPTLLHEPFHDGSFPDCHEHPPRRSCFPSHVPFPPFN